MFVNNSFGKALYFLEKGMDVSMIRRSVIADNIANAGTPNFKRSEINFESEMARAVQSESIKDDEFLKRHPKLMNLHHVYDFKKVDPKITLDYMTTEDNNGNNVNIDKEEMESLNNQLAYTMMATVANHHFSQINTVAKG